MSIVKDPAVEATLVKFNKESVSVFHFLNEEKREIYSVAMRPNKFMHRNNINGEPADVFYSKSTVEELQKDYFKSQGNSGTNINHEEQNTNGVFPFESWIVKDPTSDKSTLMGMETLPGDWVMGFKIENEEVWNQCKNGDLDGLSIEAYLGHKEISINFNKEEPMKNKILLFIKQLMASETGVSELAPGMFGTSLDTGSAIVDKDGNPVTGASFKVGDMEYYTDDMGLVKETEKETPPGGPTVEELTAKNAELEAKVLELEGEKSKTEADKTKAETDLQTMTTEKETLSAQLTSMKEEKEKVDAQLVTMAGQTAAALSIKNIPPVTPEKEYKDMTNKERMQFNRQK